MKKALLVVALLMAVIYSCQQSDAIVASAYNSVLNSSKLESQFFTVDISKDTTLLTAQRAVIKIPKGTLDARGAATVTLEVKEAYNMADILKAGLTTTSNGQPLRSGGMIYINPAKGSTAKITKPLFVATPSTSLDADMQLYKGKVKDDSTIDWADPAPLPPNPQLAKLNTGKKIFFDNCASCHQIDKDLTGPALAGSIERAPVYPSDAEGDTARISLLYEWTRRSSKVLAHGDCYYSKLYETWNKTPMNDFPSLTDADLDNLYGYIQNETVKAGIHVPQKVNDMRPCYDSCRLYFDLVHDLEATKSRLEQDSTQLVEYNREPGGTFIDKIIVPPPPELELINPLNVKSLYYQFTIHDFGWYNIDVRVDHPDDVPSNLTVHLEKHEHIAFNLYLVVPSIRMLLPGGPLKDKKDDYGFWEANGKIPLPPGANAYVFAVGEHDDSIFFAMRSFVTSPQERLTLTLTKTTKQAFEAAMQKAGIPNINITVDETKNAAPLREVIKQLKSAETLKPKHCDCECLLKLNREL